ncbi:hypothetical protein [Chryseobacterium sp. OV279]|uniref:hypothetical protein n=1 Tax=Chryseobacterium sp. OV279 TaxID=1500285 RepID=UPI000923E3A4|nr:hypothetical protein [Chryseobacterium sp. OV279]SHF81872.1 hypothetical protein SAMN02787100_2679 [Chryseobacterium sp. OV279]
MFSEKIEKIIECNIIKADEAFDYEYSPYSERFDKIHNLFWSILGHESYNYNLKDCYFFFANNFSVNAKACRHNNYNLISINSGLVVWLIKNIIENEKLEEYYKKQYGIFQKIQFYSFEELSFQMNLLFTFYHEFAHLLQQSDYLELGLEEESKSDFSLYRHALELDADTFSGVFIARHLIQYYEKDFSEFGIEYLESITVILGSNLFFYLSSFSGANKQLYFKENSHPHPFIRVIRILFTIGKYFQDDYKIKIDKIRIVSKIVDEIFFLQDTYKVNNLSSFRNEMIDSTIDIHEYLQELSDYDKLKVQSAIKIYNLRQETNGK